MQLERKQKLVKYLYPTEQIRSFMWNDLYLELKEVVPKICILSKNTNFQIRKQNLKKVTDIIKNFIQNNQNYKLEIENLYHDKNWNSIIEDIVIGYVFFVSNTVTVYNNVDILSNKKSICYSPISILDII